MNNLYNENKCLRVEFECLIYVVRHGESVGNLNKVVLGHTNLPLTEKGKEQALLTAQYLKDVKIDAIYSSDLLRAYETSLPHSLYHGLGISTDEALRELYFGDWENRAVSDLVKDYGDMFWNDWRGGFGTFTPPAGESVVDGAARLEGAILRLAKKHIGGAILVTTHAAVIRGAWARISGFEPPLWVEKVDFPTNASFSIMGYRGGRLYPISYSNDEHIGDIRTGVPKSIN